MKLFHDFNGVAILLTDERLRHILEHPEMTSMQGAIEETLRHGAFVLTAYLTDRVKKGERLWPNRRNT